MANQRSQFIVHAWVGTAPEKRITQSGKTLTTFRIADSVRWRNQDTGLWTDGKTTWYTVRVWGAQAANVAESVRKSDPVIVIGHPWLDHWTGNDGEPASGLVIGADSVSPDLSFGTPRYSRTVRSVDEFDQSGTRRIEAGAEDDSDDDLEVMGDTAAEIAPELVPADASALEDDLDDTALVRASA